MEAQLPLPVWPSVFEVLQVERTQDGVDRQLGAEGAEVAGSGDELKAIRKPNKEKKKTRP